jgi:hypothetical protein
MTRFELRCHRNAFPAPTPVVREVFYGIESLPSVGEELLRWEELFNLKGYILEVVMTKV